MYWIPQQQARGSVQPTHVKLRNIAMLAIVGFVGCVVKEERRLCKTAVNQALLITMKDYV
jgi:hypothetical protein